MHPSGYPLFVSRREEQYSGCVCVCVWHSAGKFSFIILSCMHLLSTCMLFRSPNLTDLLLLFLIRFHILSCGEVSHYWKVGWGHIDSSNFTSRSRRKRSPVGDLQGWCSIIEHRWCSAHSLICGQHGAPGRFVKLLKMWPFVAHEWPEIWPILIEKLDLDKLNAYYASLIIAHRSYLDAKGVGVWFIQSSLSVGRNWSCLLEFLTEADRILDLPH